MKFSTIALLASTASAFPFLTPRADDTCTLTGTVGDVPDAIRRRATPIPGFSTPEACRAKCYSTEYPSCMSFGIRPSSGGGSCLIFDFDIRPNIIPRQSTYTYFPLPAGDGIRGAVPENVAKHYRAVTDKTKGTYSLCRQECLGDAGCKAFGYKDGGNCQIYGESLIGKVKAKPEWAYIQYTVDCRIAGSGVGQPDIEGPTAPAKKLAA